MDFSDGDGNSTFEIVGARPFSEIRHRTNLEFVINRLIVYVYIYIYIYMSMLSTRG